MKKVFLILGILCLFCISNTRAQKQAFGNGLYLELNNGVLTISGSGSIPEYGGLRWRSNKELVKKVIIENGVTSIGAYAFSGYTNLTSVTIPNSVTSIGEYAFAECTNLTSVTIPNSVTSIGDFAFFQCTNLTSVTIPNSVTSIGDCAFFRCTNLTSVTIPNPVTSIGGAAFASCEHLSITIPGSLKSIGAGAFYSVKDVKRNTPQTASATSSSSSLSSTTTSNQSTANSTYTDAKMFGLKGKVKSVKYVGERWADKMFSHGISFLPNGQLNAGTEGGAGTIKRDKDGRIESYMSVLLILVEGYHFLYDKQGRLSHLVKKMAVLGDNDVMQYAESYSYDTNGAISSCHYGEKKTNMDDMDVDWFDVMLAGGWIKVDYQYTKFDSHGNWTERIATMKGSQEKKQMTEKRVIEYYP